MHHSLDDIDKLTDMLFQLRLREYNVNINDKITEFQEQLSRQKSASGLIARNDLIHRCIMEFEQHCSQIVSDLISQVENFNIYNALDFLKEKLDSHITIIADDFNKNLTRNCFGGISVTSSERNRINNMVSSIKVRINQKWQERTKYLLQIKQTKDIGPPSFHDLDDRLPVRKRGSFDNDLKVSVKKASQYEETLSLVMIDIDHFKKVNDMYGHQAGDEVLLEVAQCLVRRLAHKGKVYRYGGEEFAVILPTYSTDEALGLSERLRKDIEGKSIGSKELKITASFGVAGFPSDAMDAVSLIKKADTALYVSKKKGRNRVTVFKD